MLKKIFKTLLIIVLLPFLCIALIITNSLIQRFVFNKESPYVNPETYIQYGITIPNESENVFNCSKAVSFNEVQGVAEFRLNENCDLSVFESYELTDKYDESIDSFFDDLFEHYDDPKVEAKFQEYLDYYKTHDAYVKKGYVLTYCLYYPEDSKVIILFCQ